ncbi:acyl-CoA dehydrogenase family protein [Rhodococcoides yunnanense]|uniref:acyl-CoA dehydrogenase family protein n=1 Tax=Rhodococcoides yunnanense TaxID=278209 RepID=UPI000AA52ECD|nr:acyl-CoA dehydrogenase family protein [Rhodococcus yunnanensis]
MAISTTTPESPWPRSEPSAMTPGDEQAGLRDAVRGTLDKHSTIEKIRAVSSTEAGYSPELWRRLVEDMSVTTIAAPADRGGLGYGMVEMGIILEECGRSLTPEPVYQSAILGVQALMHSTTDDSLPLLDSVLGGDSIAAVSDLSADSDHLQAGRIDSDWVVDGQALHVVGGSGADVVVISAQHDGQTALFAVPKSDAVSSIDRSVLDPTRRQADLTFTRAPATILASGAEASDVVSRLRDIATLAIASENTGIADALLQMTLDYVKTRHQFGRPIGSFQAVKHRLADMLIELERARSAARYAAAVYDENPDDARVAIAVAGAVCSDAAVHAAHEAVQLHGGVGFTWEHPAHSYFRRAMGNAALQGDSRSHRRRIADLIGV